MTTSHTARPVLMATIMITKIAICFQALNVYLVYVCIHVLLMCQVVWRLDKNLTCHVIVCSSDCGGDEEREGGKKTSIE